MMVMTSLPPALKPSGNACTACAVAAPTLWNSLPVDIKNEQSLPVFKKRLKTFLCNELQSFHHVVLFIMYSLYFLYLQVYLFISLILFPIFVERAETM